MTRPTIKTTIYFDPTQPARYATNEHITYLNEKGIPTPTHPIVRDVVKAEVTESNGKITNWREQPSNAIKKYETTKLNQQHLSFEQRLQKQSAINNKTFPAYLPVELVNFCSNGSTFSLNIDEYHVEITVQSKEKFYLEHTQRMSEFYEDPVSRLSSSERKKLIKNGTLTKIIEPIEIMPNFTIVIKGCMHGQKGCRNNEKFIKRLCVKKISPHNNSAYRYTINRALGIRKADRPHNMDLDFILDGCLRELESNNTTKSNGFLDFLKKDVNYEHGRHGNECELF